MSTTRIRTSRLPLLSLCPASAVAPRIRTERGGEAASLGKGVHALLCRWVRGVPDGWEEEVAAAAALEGYEESELRRLVWKAMGLWKDELSGYFPNPQPEEELSWTCPISGITLTGHPDLYSVVGHEVRVLDWKTGRDATADHTEQLRGYAWLLLQRFPECTRAFVLLVPIREGVPEGRYYSREELEMWWKGMVILLLAGGSTYHPGRHCGYCPRGLECEAKTALVRQAATSLLAAGFDPAYLEDLPLEDQGPLLADLRDRIQLLRGVCDRLDDVIKAKVQLAGGALPIGDGLQLQLLDQPRRKVLPAEAWPVLLEHVSHEALLQEVVQVPKTRLEEAIKARAPTRGKGKAVTEVFARLEQAGALVTETTERLEVRRLPIEGEPNGTANRDPEQQRLPGPASPDPAGA